MNTIWPNVNLCCTSLSKWVRSRKVVLGKASGEWQLRLLLRTCLHYFCHVMQSQAECIEKNDLLFLVSGVSALLDWLVPSFSLC